MGKKYIIELEDKPFHKGNGDFLYRAKGFNSLVFDMNGVGKLTPYTEPDLDAVRKEAYQEGFNKGLSNTVMPSEAAAYEKGYLDAEKSAYKRGYETAKHECEDCRELRGGAEQELASKAYQRGYCDALEKHCAICEEKHDAEEAYQQGLNDLWEAMQKAIKMYCEIDNEVFLRVFYDVKCDWGESVLEALFKNTPQHLIDSIRKYEQKQEEIQVGDEVEWMGDKYVVTYVMCEAKKADLISCKFGSVCENVAFSALVKTGRHFPEIAEVLRKMRE